MDLGLARKTVIVTGGASNIGRAISLAFAGEQATVVIADKDRGQGQKVADEANKLGGQAILIGVDLTNYDEVETLVKRVVGDYGRVDILVNNVGWDQLHPFAETTPDFWDTIIGINYKTVLSCTRVVLPYMIEQRSGAIVNIGSDAGRMGEYGEAVYSGCKGAVIALTKTVALEVGRYGIRVNVVSPGMTVPAGPEEIGENSGWKDAPFTTEQLEKAAKAYPLRKLGKPIDIANAVLFFASDVASGHITAQTLSVSGGFSRI